jgi:excisionase family DNA binding protein
MGEAITLAEAARQLSISTRTARRWIRSGALPAALGPGRNGPRYLVPVTALESLRAQRATRFPTRSNGAGDPRSGSVQQAWSDLVQTQQALRSTMQELSRMTAEMRRLREDLDETRQLIRADRASLATDSETPTGPG